MVTLLSRSFSLVSKGKKSGILRCLILCCLLGSFVYVAPAFASPFTGGQRANKQQAVENAPHSVQETQKKSLAQHAELTESNRHAAVTSDSLALYYTKFLRIINQKQRELRRTMARLAREIRHKPMGKAFWWLLGLSFVYGVVHALGPGHGKSVVFAYFLGRRGSIWKGFVMGHLLTGIHVLSAVVLVLGLHFLVGKASSSAMDSTGELLQQISYACVAFIGVVMLGCSLYEFAKVLRRKNDSPLHVESSEAGMGSIGAVSLAAGLIPCPGAALVLSFCLSLGILSAGLLSMVTFALGMGLTTAIFGIFSIVSRSALMHVAGRGPKVVSVLYSLFSVFASGAIVAIGLLMLLSMDG